MTIDALCRTVQLVSAAATLGVSGQLGVVICEVASCNVADFSRTSLPAALSAAAVGLGAAAKGMLYGSRC